MKSFLRCSFLTLLLLAPTAAWAQTGGGSQATITLIGQINRHNDRTCFRIRPVANSFNVRDVDLASLMLQFGGQTLAPLADRTHLQFECDEEEGGGNDGGGDSDSTDHGDCDSTGHGDCDSTGHHDDAASLRLSGGIGDDDPEGNCEDCDDDCVGCNADSCDAVGIKVCFATTSLVDLFGDTLADSLGSATIQFQLNDGTVIVATFENGSLGKHGHGDMDVMARPNPLNPRTVLTFTLSRPGRVQVAVYDLQGRLVSRISDQVRSAGPQTLVWDGSNSRNARVSSGVYFFRIQAPEGQVVQRVAVVK